MTEFPDLPSSLLGDALTDALDRAVGTSLESLTVLRLAVKNYTQHQKKRGVPLDRVMVALGTALTDSEDEKRDGGLPEKRDPELARQLRAWCSDDYSSG
jgi:hypothetical protein